MKRSLAENPHEEPATVGSDSLTSLNEDLPYEGTASVPVPTFLPGERAANRFRIVRLVGQGGMGQVFEAFDEELSTRVALKVIRPEIAGSQRAMDLFKTEVQLAREVTHPNVCRIFDLFFHNLGSTDWGTRRDETRFLTMEFLEGESLGRRLQASPPLQTAEAHHWAQRLISGLAAMHKAGVTHRDLKPENILLVSSQGNAASQIPGRSLEDVRPVITDFGLAIADQTSRPEETSPNAGTPAYAAPEQKAGQPLTCAADVYSFGLILLELQEATQSKRRSRRSPSKRSLEQRALELPSPWARAIRRCLEEKPEDRYRDAGELQAALFPRKTWPRSSLGFAAVFATVIALSLFFFSRKESSAPTELVDSSSVSIAETEEAAVEPPLISAPRPTLMLPPFTTSNPGDAWLAEALWTATVQLMQPYLGVRLLETSPLATAYGEEPRLALLPLADISLQGSLARSGDDELPRLEWTLEISPGEAVPLPQDLNLADYPSIPQAAVSLFQGIQSQLEAVGVENLPPEIAGTAKKLSGFPRDQTALKALAEARLALRDERPEEALEKLRQAEVLGPDAWMVSLTKARAQAFLGFDRRAAAAAERAFQLAARELPETRDRLEAFWRSSQGQWRAAARLYRSLWNRYPDNLGYGLALAQSQLFGVGVEATAATLGEVAESPGHPLERIQESILRGHFHQLLGELTQQGDFAGKAAEQAMLLEAPDLLLEALFLQADSLFHEQNFTALERVRQHLETKVAQGTWSDLEVARATLAVSKSGGRHVPLSLGPSLAEKRKIFSASGNLRDACRILAIQALALGNTTATRPEALALAQKALVEARRSESPQAQSEAHRAMAVLNHLEAKHATAAEHFGAAVIQAREVGKIVLLAGALRNHALQLHRIGKLRQSQERFAEAEALFEASGEERGQISALFQSGSLLSELGDLPGAVRNLEEAHHKAQLLENSGLVARAVERLAYTLDLQGKTERANELFEEALQLWDSLDEGAGSRTRIYLALRQEESMTSETAKVAEQEIRRLLTLGNPQPGPYFQILAQINLARALLKQGRLEKAAQALKIEDAFLVHTQDRPLAFEIARATALLESAQGHTDVAVRRIQDQLAQAEASGSILKQLELRLTLSRILKEGGRPEAAALQRESVLRQAEEFGYVSLAQRAQSQG
ncbi:MAG: protein kinase [Deltaproteobacteria bacterium]|nr:protein kinase [Deltaproteobacteria bacterium]